MTAGPLDAAIRPLERHRAPAAVAVLACLAALYWWGWGDGVGAALRALVADSGANTSGTVTVRGQAWRLLDNALLTCAGAAAFCVVRRLACGYAVVRPGRGMDRGMGRDGDDRTNGVFRAAWARWWNAGFAYVFCMMAGFASIDATSALLRTTFHSYPFGTRYENGFAALLYLANMFFAGPTEELVLLGLTVVGLRWVGSPWWLVTCAAVALRVPFHLYYGWAAFAIGVWPVLAVMLYRRVGMITPMIVAHGMYDVSTAMTSMTGVAGSPWPLVVALAIMVAPVVWAAAIIVRRAHPMLRSLRDLQALRR
ncbi:type II CAAX prenyl endopeptidase Rce1 family protein [Bifidobacterium avesanii]|uniref:CPBP family intramembrane metalloprotease n=1 Tax=Bifidobacterium avesanii TaxID=1798157 RepID=A0A7K3TGV1_9BIFI|nr:CPBP family intramembrane glutamic endopeptidase [Bifidobacterium avesanii]KAB8291438.1 hypothetical protein DSM100685_1156 [Bifidobacterium avesanii]NEG77929.1 CPBP family intramembrane metalloprotease [Bifidobacterium avesanii]